MALTLCASCSSAPKELRLGPGSAAITGELGEYVEVVSGIYKVSPSTESSQSLETQIKLRVKKAMTGNKEVESLSLNVLDGVAMPVAGLKEFEVGGSGYYEAELAPLRSLLKTGAGDIIVRFHMSGDRDDALETIGEHANEAKKFAVAGMLRVTEKAEETALTTASGEQSNGKPEDCDKYLAHFDALMTSYAHIATKLSKNPLDLSILAEYADMTTNLQDLEKDKPTACNGNQAFAKHYARIVAKMSKAAAAQTKGMAKQQSSNMDAMLEAMSK